MSGRWKTLLRTCSLFAIAGAALMPMRAVAQTAVEQARVAAEVARVASNLPENSRSVIARLTMLRQLPDGAWKGHAGDVPHAEPATLDASRWETAKIPSKAPNDALWFRQTYTVPETLTGYDLTGARIW